MCVCVCLCVCVFERVCVCFVVKVFTVYTSKTDMLGMAGMWAYLYQMCVWWRVGGTVREKWSD